MQLIVELCREHRELEEHAEMLLGIVAAPVPDAAAVAALRWEMAKRLADHLGREDRAIYDRLMISGDAAATAVALAYRREHGPLNAWFGRYIAEWPVARVAREWDAFRAETRDVIAALAARIEREEQVLYHHAERVMIRRAAA